MENTVKYQPKFGRVLIKRKVEEVTKGGIILTENTAKRHATCEGVIIALGETAGWVEVQGQDIQTLNVGDNVIFGKHAGAWIDATYGANNNEGTLFICSDADILAVIRE